MSRERIPLATTVGPCRLDEGDHKPRATGQGRQGVSLWHEISIFCGPCFVLYSWNWNDAP
jgi:hypothetical protein